MFMMGSYFWKIMTDNCIVSGERRPCRSELARESGVSVNIDVESDGPFASKLAPTGFESAMTQGNVIQTAFVSSR
jgi:hypothetical protein